MYRKGTLEDVPYVSKTWGIGYQESYERALCINLPDRMGVPDNHLARLMAGRYVVSRKRIIAGWLSVPYTAIEVLALRQEPRMIVAFAVWTEIGDDEARLHWIHVQRDWRGKGLSKILLARLERPRMSYTHYVAVRQPNGSFRSAIEIKPHWVYESEQPPIKEQP